MESGCCCPSVPCPSSVPVPWDAHRCLGWLQAKVPVAQCGLSLSAGVVHGVWAVPASCPLSPGLAANSPFCFPPSAFSVGLPHGKSLVLRCECAPRVPAPMCENPGRISDRELVLYEQGFALQRKKGFKAGTIRRGRS